MNYQHQYHAGNFADVIKHMLLVALLGKMNNKDKPYHYIDTHAGAGIYNLASAAAQKTGEFLHGVHRVMQIDPQTLRHAPEAVQRYVAALNGLRAELGQGAYGGSPWWAETCVRDSEQLSLLELQPDICYALKKNMTRANVGVHNRDGYEGLMAMIPPQQKRGVVMIDPPYELERKDFPQLVDLLVKAHTKWSTGVFVLWYPIKDREMINRFEKKMLHSGIRRQLICELCVWPDDIAAGLNGCGLLVINPPFGFADDADAILQWVFPYLRQHPTLGHAALRWLVGE